MKRTNKKILSTVLVLLMLISALPIGGVELLNFGVKANAAKNGSCGENVTWTLSDDGVLTVGGTGAMTDYANQTEVPWSYGDLKAVVINEGVTHIGDYAFEFAKYITDVTIADSVTSIGDYAFAYCDGIKEITLPAGVTELGDSVFEYCVGLTNITIPNGVKSIGFRSFIECSSLTSVKLPDGLTNIGKWAFAMCRNLTDITIPDSVTEIGEYAFSTCISLTSLKLPDGFKDKGNGAFKLVANVEYSTSEYIGARTTNGYIENGLVYKDASKTELTACPATMTGEVIVPDSVTVIGDNAFYECGKITGITLPSGLTSIGENAFFKCSGLTELIIPETVKTVGDLAFSGCTGLTSMEIPDGIHELNLGLFMSCTALKNVTLPDSLRRIESRVFEKCGSLTEIKIPDNVYSIGVSAFQETALKNVTLSKNVKTIPSWAFNGCNDLTDIFIYNSEIFIYDETNTISPTAAIHGYYASTAQSYAKKYGRTFIPFEDHEHIYTATVTKEATCTQDGEMLYVCNAREGCEDSYTEVIDALGHDPSAEWTVDTAATCTTDGTKSHRCTRCDEKEDVTVIPALGHTDENKDGKCDVCGESTIGDCSHFCHSENAFAKMFWKMIRSLFKLFKTQEFCDCGVRHW